MSVLLSMKRETKRRFLSLLWCGMLALGGTASAQADLIPQQAFRVQLTSYSYDLTHSYLVYAAMNPGDNHWLYSSLTPLKDSDLTWGTDHDFVVNANVGTEAINYDRDNYTRTVGLIAVYREPTDVMVAFESDEAYDLVVNGATFHNIFNADESLTAQRLMTADTEALAALTETFKDRSYLTLGETGKLIGFCAAWGDGDITISHLPEPMSLTLLALGGLSLLRRK